MFNCMVCLIGAGFVGYISFPGLNLVTLDLMEAWECLESFAEVRALLEESSNNTSGWWRYFWGSPQAKLVCRIKEDYKWEFEQLLKSCGELLDSLNLGHQALFQDKIIRTLDFSTPGRIAAGVAFLAFLKDKWSEETHLSSGYVLDFLAIQLWRAWIRHKNRMQLLSSVRPLLIQPEEQQTGPEDRARLEPEERAPAAAPERSAWNLGAGLNGHPHRE